METVPLRRRVYIGLLASLPGLAVMALAWRTLTRLMREAMGAGAGADGVSARPIHPDALAEQRFAKVVAEMAIAAAIPPPCVLVADSDAVNAAAFGVDRSNASIVITSGLLAELDRAELQGVAADLVGSIANGDMAVGAKFAAILGMFGLISQLGNGFTDREAARRFLRLLGRSLRPWSSVDDGNLSHSPSAHSGGRSRPWQRLQPARPGEVPRPDFSRNLALATTTVAFALTHDDQMPGIESRDPATGALPAFVSTHPVFANEFESHRAATERRRAGSPARCSRSRR